MSLKIGALVPASRIFPGADLGFVNGLRGALADAGVTHELVIEPTGACNHRDQVTEKVQRVLLQQAPDVVTGVMGAGLSRHMHTFFADVGTPFVINDLGGDPVMTGASRNPFIFVNTLDVFQSACALGSWAARHLGTRAVIAAALHEGGYGMVPAFWHGFVENGGGSVLGTEVTHRATADDDPSEQVRRLAALEPDFVMGFYSGREGVSFARAYAEAGLAGRVPLAVTPLMLHGKWIDPIAASVTGAVTAISWNPSAHPEENDQFRRLAKVGPGGDPAVFSLLGYETGRMIAAAAARSPENLRAGLSGVEFMSPRGAMKVDEVSGQIATTDYLQRLSCDADGAPALVTEGVLDLPATYRTFHDALQRQDERTGWLNPYMIT